jgi:crotonobetainyl-CoA:carnitine CoA-transferase CaiB-like acyl-CoA transferase
VDQLLTGMRIVEGSAFVAAPLGGMTLAQLGADVIRFDPIGGGLDARRWPVTAKGRSLFWAGLNKGKRSVAIDIRSPRGRDLIAALVAAPGPDAGFLLTNLPAKGWLSYDALRAQRPDVVMVTIVGNPDGSSAVDYTINPATGFPWATGPAAEGGIGGVPQPLPGVVFPQLAQLQAGVLAIVQVTAGRHPGQQRDQDRLVMAGEIGRTAQRVHAARRSADPGEDPACARHGGSPLVR